MKLYNPKHTLRRVMAVLALAIPLWGGAVICAQEADSTATAKEKPMSFFDRFSISTNALEWLLTVPNLGIEFDLSGGEYNNQSILVAAKYNWDTWHQHPAYYVFNLLDVKGEYRYHFRFQQAGKDEKFKLFSLNRQNPRTHLAYYIGTYGNYMQYSVKPGKSGLQGWGASLGGVIGFEKPLYEYKRSHIDLDLGLALGVGFSMFDRYRMSSSGDNYALQGNGWMIMPVLAEVRAAFTWRPVSVKDKYTGTDPQIEVCATQIEDINIEFGSINKDDFDTPLRDSIKTVNARRLEDLSSDDDEGKENLIYKEYLNYLRDNRQNYRSSFKKYLSEKRDDMMIRFVGCDSLSKKIPESYNGLDKHYLTKLKNVIDTRISKVQGEFDKQLKKDLQELSIMDNPNSNGTSPNKRMSKDEYDKKKKELLKAQDKEEE